MKNIIHGGMAEQGSAEVVAVIGGTIIDGNGGRPIDDGVILIGGKRITAVGDRSIPIPPRAKQIRAVGKFVIPGLMDPFVVFLGHHWPPDLVRCEGRYDEVAIEAAQYALRAGVTTLFDGLGPRDPLIKARNAINEGRATGARIYVGGQWVGAGGLFSRDLCDAGGEDVGEMSGERKAVGAIAALDAAFKARVNALYEVNVGEALTRMSLEEARQEVRKYVQSGIDFVTYLVNVHRLGSYQYIVFSTRVQRMIVEEAHRAGLPVKAFFASTEEGIHLALDAGADMLVAASWEGKPLSAETLALVAERGISVLCDVFPTEDLEWYRRQPPNALYPGVVKQKETSELDHRGLLRAGARLIGAGFGGMYNENQLKLFTGMAPGSFSQFGEAHVRGLRALQQKGMTPMDALMSATRNVARAYKVDADLGTLERGKLADLVVLDSNPLENPRNYRDIHLVIKDGKVVDRDALPTQRVWTAAPVESN